MNDFKKEMQVNKAKRSFYKTFEKGQNNQKIYKSSIVPEGEFNSNSYLRGVSCFLLDEQGNILVEKRADTKLTPGKLDIVSGHIEGNETPTQAMIREYVEELHSGSELEAELARREASQNLKKLEELDLIFQSRGEERKFFIQFFVMKTKLKTYTKQLEEVEGIKWVPQEVVWEAIRQNKTKFPYVQRFEKIFQQVREAYQEKEKEK